MKNIQNIAIGILACAVIYLLAMQFMCSSDCQKPSTQKSDSTQKSTYNEPFAYVNTDSLMKGFKLYQTLVKQAEQKRNSAEKNFLNKKEKFEAAVGKYQQEAAGLSADLRQIRETALAQQQQELVNFEQSETQKILLYEQEQTEEIFQKIHDYLKIYTEDKPYRLVLAYQKASAILYAPDSLDITAEVLKGLNEKYK
jgi:outer membrane protein